MEPHEHVSYRCEMCGKPLMRQDVCTDQYGNVYCPECYREDVARLRVDDYARILALLTSAFNIAGDMNDQETMNAIGNIETEIRARSLDALSERGECLIDRDEREAREGSGQ